MSTKITEETTKRGDRLMKCEINNEKDRMGREIKIRSRKTGNS